MRRHRSRTVAGGALATALTLASCSAADEGTLVGSWTADDGRGVKTVLADGTCTGMYYTQGGPLDIGGGMTCSFSTKEDSDGKHALVVTQPPNQTTLRVRLVDADIAELYSGQGELLTTLTRL